MLEPISNIITALGFSEDTEEKTCEIHGPYIAKRRYFNGKLAQQSSCPKCRAIELQFLKEAEERKAAAEEEARRARWREEQLQCMAVPPRYRRMTLEKFEVSDDARKGNVLLAVSNYVRRFDELRADGVGFVLLGDSGTGKTHLACGVLIALMEKARGMYLTLNELIGKIHESYDQKSEKTSENIFQALEDCPLLVVDEVGRTRMSEAVMDEFFRVVDARYRKMMPTIFISNASTPEEFEALLSPATAERIGSMCKYIRCSWSSYRRGPQF